MNVFNKRAMVSNAMNLWQTIYIGGARSLEIRTRKASFLTHIPLDEISKRVTSRRCFGIGNRRSKATLMRNMRWECGYLKRKARSFGFTPLQNKDLLWQ